MWINYLLLSMLMLEWIRIHPKLTAVKICQTTQKATDQSFFVQRVEKFPSQCLTLTTLIPPEKLWRNIPKKFPTNLYEIHPYFIWNKPEHVFFAFNNLKLKRKARRLSCFPHPKFLYFILLFLILDLIQQLCINLTHNSYSLFLQNF